MAQRTIDIPTKDSSTLIEIPISELADQDPEEIIYILQEEQAFRELYLRFAIEYFKFGNVNAFIELIKSGLKHDESIFGRHDDERRTDPIGLNNAMAAYYISQATKSRDIEKRNSFLELAHSHLNESDRIDLRNWTSWIGKGIWILLQGRFEQAKYQFNMVLNEQPDNIIAKIGIGCVEYHDGNYLKSLSVFQELLRKYPRMNPDPRIGIAVCFHKLGDQEKAELAIKRALVINPSNQHASILLGIMYLNRARLQLELSNAKKYIIEAINLFKKAKQVDHLNPALNVYFTEVLFQKGLIEKSAEFLDLVFSCTEDSSILAYAYFYKGRSEHLNRNFTDALVNYKKSAQLNGNLYQCYFAMAQCNLALKDFDKALKYAKKASEAIKNPALDKILAFLYSKENEKYHKKSVSLYEQICNHSKDDWKSWLKLGRLLEKTDIPKAIRAYESAVNISTTKDFKFQLYNTIAALYHEIEDYDKAEDYYETALEMFKELTDTKSENVHKYDQIFLTLLYNLARLYEVKYPDTEKAQSLYEKILHKDPSYVDAILRRGAILEKLGDHDGALALYKEVIGKNEKNVDAITCEALLELKLKNYKPSKHAFTKILQKIDHHDSYSLVSLGNERLWGARHEKAENKERLYKEAVRLFDKALRCQPDCAYAVNGLGIALAETSNLHEAKQAFSIAREANENLYAAQMNLAHVMVEMGQYQQAVSIYKGVDSKFLKGQDKHLLLYTARSIYILGKVESSPAQMSECVKLLEEAKKQAPSDPVIDFNISLACQQYAHLVSEEPEEKRSTARLEMARQYWDRAKQGFQLVKANEECSKYGIDARLVSEREKYCISIEKILTRRISQQKANEELQRGKMEEFKRKREQELEEKRRKEEEAKRKAQEEEEALLNARRQLQEDLMAEQIQLKAKKEEESRRKSVSSPKKPGKSMQIVDDEDESDEDQEEEPETVDSSHSPSEHEDKDDDKLLDEKLDSADDENTETLKQEERENMPETSENPAETQDMEIDKPLEESNTH